MAIFRKIGAKRITSYRSVQTTYSCEPQLAIQLSCTTSLKLFKLAWIEFLDHFQFDRLTHSYVYNIHTQSICIIEQQLPIARITYRSVSMMVHTCIGYVSQPYHQQLLIYKTCLADAKIKSGLQLHRGCHGCPFTFLPVYHRWLITYQITCMECYSYHQYGLKRNKLVVVEFSSVLQLARHIVQIWGLNLISSKNT